MSDQRTQKIAAVALCLVILGSIGWLVSRSKRGPAYDWRNHYAAIGRVIAEETLKGLGPNASLVIQKYEGANPVLDHTLALLRRAGATVLATEEVPFSPEPVTTGARYVALCQKYPGAAAILTYCGNPRFAPAEAVKLPAARPRLIIIGADTNELRGDCAAGLVSLAFVTRRGPRQTTTSEPKNYREVFDESFQVIRSGAGL